MPNLDITSSPVRSSGQVKSPNLQKCLQLCHTQFFSSKSFKMNTLSQAGGIDHRERFLIDDRKCSKQLKTIHIYQVGLQLLSGIPKVIRPTFFAFMDLLDLLAFLPCWTGSPCWPWKKILAWPLILWRLSHQPYAKSIDIWNLEEEKREKL